MRTSSNSGLTIVSVGTIVLMFCGGWVAATQQDEGVTNVVAAREFVRMAYPELVPLQPSIQVSTLLFLTPTPIRFGRFTLDVLQEVGGQRPRVILQSEFTFAEAGKLQDFRASGSLLRDRENETFSHDVGRHAEWTEDRILQELVSRGAQFASDREKIVATSKILVRDGERLLGTLSLESAIFRMPGEESRRDGLIASDLHWVLTYQGAMGVQTVFVVEPFGGRLTLVSTSRRR